MVSKVCLTLESFTLSHVVIITPQSSKFFNLELEVTFTLERFTFGFDLRQLVVKLFIERYLKVLDLIFACEQILFAVSFVKLKFEFDEPVKFKDLRYRHLLFSLAHLLNLNLTLPAIDFIKI